MVGYRIRQLPREFQFDSGVGGSTAAQPKLVLLSRLHLDSGPYRLVLTAYDGGEPAALTGSTTVVVSVEDSNDHEPTFEKELVTVQVRSVIIVVAVNSDSVTVVKANVSQDQRLTKNELLTAIQIMFNR